jgi:hypothetical protein
MYHVSRFYFQLANLRAPLRGTSAARSDVPLRLCGSDVRPAGDQSVSGAAVSKRRQPRRRFTDFAGLGTSMSAASANPTSAPVRGSSPRLLVEVWCQAPVRELVDLARRERLRGRARALQAALRDPLRLSTPVRSHGCAAAVEADEASAIGRAG